MKPKLLVKEKLASGYSHQQAIEMKVHTLSNKLCVLLYKLPP